jgi:hypothetical protein
MSNVLRLVNNKTGETTVVDIEGQTLVNSKGKPLFNPKNVERANKRTACGFGNKGPRPPMPSSEAEAVQWEAFAASFDTILDTPGSDAMLGKTGTNMLASAQERILRGVKGFRVMTEHGWTLDDFAAPVKPAKAEATEPTE